MNLYSRRNFLGGCAALGALPTLRTFADAVASKPLMKLGVVSDMHINRSGDEKWWKRSLEFFRDRGVDGVVCCGDFADTGTKTQMKIFADVWYSVFPEGKYPDGRKCEQLFVYGNHCIDFWQREKGLKENPDKAAAEAIGVGDNRAKFWEEIFHEPFAPVWIKKLNGCTIIGAHWRSWERPECKLEAFLEAHRSEIDPAKPFLYLQHDHVGGTTFDKWGWGNDRGRSFPALAKFPNCVAFTGHSHYTLTDDRGWWQNEFTSVNAGSLVYSSKEYSLVENSIGNDWGHREKRRHKMWSNGTDDGRQGAIATFYPDRIEIERREFYYGTESLGPDWIIPFPAKGDPALTYAGRAAKRSAPEFAPDAVLKIGKTDQRGEPRIALTVPPALMVDGCRPFHFEATATIVEDGVDLVQAQRRVLTADFHRSLLRMNRDTPIWFDPKELVEKGHYVFSVRPVDCFGAKGRAITAETIVE